MLRLAERGPRNRHIWASTGRGARDGRVAPCQTVCSFPWTPFPAIAATTLDVRHLSRGNRRRR